MTGRSHMRSRTAASVACVLFLASATIAQPRADARNFEGIWNFSTLTLLERPAFGPQKATLTEEEAAALEAQILEMANLDRRDGPNDVDRAYNQFWIELGTHITPTRRTSLIVDPPDGRVPPLTPEARQRYTARGAARAHPTGPEDLSVVERCLVGFNAGPPIVPNAYNNYVQLIQTPGYVTIMTEMIHDARIVPLDDRPHLPSHMRRWQGDSRGHWDGDTLVVDTVNFTDQTTIRGSGPNLRVTERFTRVDADTLKYEFAMEDPAFTAPWRAELFMRRSTDRIYEYACHEANYSLVDVLRGERATDQRRPTDQPRDDRR